MASSGIPLHCSVCPKKPNFSDVSHLLTHIASKGHLSHYYKIKVKSAQEDASRKTIEAYDRWYVEWRVEDLMSERMSQKDKKKSRSRNSTKSSQSHSRRSAQSSQLQLQLQLQTRTLSHPLDPRLADPRIKEEPRPTPPPFLHLPYAPQYDPRMARMWPGSHPVSPSSFGNPGTEYDYTHDGILRGTRRHYHRSINTSAILDDEDNDNEAEETETATTTSSECTKLKGVYWPGMDLFDSATPEMRRKRNQKKDSSVVEQLEVNSQEVEPTEMIFTPHGSFKRQRRISGSSLDESSPIKSDFSPQETSRFKRPALADLEPNVQRRSRTTARVSRAKTSFGSRDTFEDDHSELGFATYGGGVAPASRRRAFEVFHDQGPTYHAAQPSSMKYLTSEFHHHGSDVAADGKFSKARGQLPSTLYHPDEKENFGHSHFTYPTYYAAAPVVAQQYAQYPVSQNEIPATFYTNSIFYNPYQNEPNDAEQDDQRTITAPPSDS